MKLCHGSPVPNLTVLKPSLSTHSRALVYLTDIPELAAIYAHNSLTPPNYFFSYYVRDGALHYDEYFPGQLEEFYSGKAGYVYSAECDPTAFDLPEKMPWIYMSENPVVPTDCRYIPDLCAELLDCEREGRLTIHRYATQSEKYLATMHRLISQEMAERHLRDDPTDEYASFLREHFPDLF